MGFAEAAVGGGGGGGGWGAVAPPRCDYCNFSQALLFCRTDSAYMCMACDSKIHDTISKLGPRHERVWLCQACEQAPASLTCKADAAVLCVTCDRDIHSANPLAQRHERVPLVSFYNTAESAVKSTSSFVVPLNSPHGKLSACGAHKDSNMIDPWISSDLTDSKGSVHASDNKSIELLLSDMDNYLDVGYSISLEAQFQQEFCSITDGVVPVQTIKPTVQPQLPIHSSEKHFEIDFSNPHIKPCHSSYTQSLSQSVSSSSMDMGVVSDANSMSEISGTGMDMGGAPSGNQAAGQVVGMDREARVLRYREKRKNRKFEKKIRYASRKAYAETRPRIKGRFAKRTEVDSDAVDRLFGHDSTSAFFSDDSYGVVPSF